jgi:hypothetical protein
MQNTAGDTEKPKAHAFSANRGQSTILDRMAINWERVRNAETGKD